MRRTVGLLILSILILLVLPAVIVLPFRSPISVPLHHSEVKLDNPVNANQPAITVSVFRSQTGQTERLQLNKYLIGVVGSEMPAKFPLEALKAQALASRTYILEQLLRNPDSKVSDTVQNQVYHSPAELKKIWGRDYFQRMRKISEAVTETSNQVITYRGNLITPFFFSTSNGRTENADAYWQRSVPYLRSVASPWDKKSPKFKQTKEIPLQTVEKELGIPIRKPRGEIGTVRARTSTHHVAQYRIDGKTFSGRTIREKLKLSSTDFSLVRQGDQIVARTVGSGHDVGMSQYGAAGMAAEGEKVGQIVSHYYPGTKIAVLGSQTQKALAKK